jgi:ubiquinone/menaquinone biosynthesis C-methylase UbiE
MDDDSPSCRSWLTRAMSSFDERAATWDDDPAKVTRARSVAEAIIDAVRPDGSSRLLEYGAGTGLVAQALRHAVGPITLADTSRGMRDVMHGKIAAGILPDARVWDLDLETEPAPDERFDLVVTVLTLHHVHDIATVLAKFAELLAGGGRLCVADLDAEDGSFHGPGVDVHHGFDRSELADALTEAGFTDVAFRDCYSIDHDDASFPMFLATCRTRSGTGR